MTSLIWQPIGVYQPGADFEVLLDLAFARDVASLCLPQETREKFKRNAQEHLRLNEKGYSYPEVYEFYNNSLLVKEFHLGNNGVWLATNFESGRIHGHEDSLIYHSHNVGSEESSYTLMALVDYWVSYIDILKGFCKPGLKPSF